MKLHLPKGLLVAVLAAMTFGSSAYAWRIQEITCSNDQFYVDAFEFQFGIQDGTNVASNSTLMIFGGNYGAGYAKNRFVFTTSGSGEDEIISLTLERIHANGTTVHNSSTFAFANGVTTLERGEIYTVKYYGGINENVSADIVNSEGTIVASFTGGSHNMNGTRISPVNTSFTNLYAPAEYQTWNATEGESANWNYTDNSWVTTGVLTDTTLVEGADVVFGSTGVKNVVVTEDVYVDTVSIQDDYNFKSQDGAAINATNINIAADKELTVDGQLCVEYPKMTITGDGAMVIKNGGELYVTDSADTQITLGDFTTLNASTALQTEEGGFIRYGFNHTTSAELKLTESIALNHNVKAEGAMVIHGNGSEHAMTVGTGKTLIAKSQTGTDGLKGLELINQGVLNITGGTVQASEMTLGHTSNHNEGIYWGKLNMTGGSLETGTVYLRHNHKNVFSVTGGTLEFTQADAFNRLSPTNNGGAQTLNTATTITIQGTDDLVTLKANTCDWTLDGAGLATAPVIGNVTIDENNAHAITFKNVALTGTIANNKELALGGSINVAENNTATITSGKLTVLNTLSNTTGTLVLNTSTIYVNADDLAVFSHTEGTVAYSLSGDVNATNELSNGFKMTSGATYYIAEGSNISTSVKSVNLDESTSYALTPDTTGLGFVYGVAVRSDEYYISSGDVTVDSTVQALADSYIVTGGTMLVTEGSIAGININYTAGAINLSETAMLTGLVAASDSAKLGAITGSGTVEVSVANNWDDTIGIADAFVGTVYVNGGSRFTYDSNGLGTTLKLAEGVHMQVNNGGSLTDTLTLESGNHQVQVNGENTFNITGTINGEGTFDKRGDSSTVNINADAVVSRYTNTVGTTNVFGGEVNYLINAGGTTNVSGGEVGNIMISAGTLNLTGNATITGEGATNKTNRFAGIYSSHSGTIYVGNGTEASTVTTTRLEMGDNSADTLNIMQKATFIVTGGDVAGTGAVGEPNAYWQTGFLLGEWHGATTMNVEGTLLVKNAHIGHGDNTGHIYIKDGAVVAAKGLHGSKNHGSSSANGRINLTLEDDGKLILGEGGIDVSNLDSSLAAGTIGISADATIADGLTLTSANGTIFDTQKYNWNDAGTTITQGTEGGTLTISGVISGEGKLVKNGAGTLMLSGTNTYTGATTVEGGTLQITEAAAVNSSAGVSMESGAGLKYTGSGTETLSTPLSGAGSFTMAGSGTLTLSGANTYTGATTVESGTLQVAGVSAINSSSGISIGSGAELKYTGSGEETLSTTLSDAGSFTMAGTGTLTVNTRLSHTGGTTIESGTLKQADTHSVLGEKKNVTVKNGATLDVNGQEAYYILTLGGGDAETAAVLTNTGVKVDDTKKQLYSITLADDATVTGDAGMCMVASNHGQATLKLAGNTLTKTGSNTFTISRATVSEGTIKVLQGKVLAKQAGNSGTGSLNLSAASVYVGNQSNSTGTFELDSVDQSVKDLTFDGGTVSILTQKTLTATGTTQVKSTGGTLSGNLVATAGEVSFANKATLNLSNGADLKVKSASNENAYVRITAHADNASIAAESGSAQLAQMQADASFTIADMTLTNTTITAATVTTRVNLSNVSGAVKLQAGTFGLEAATTNVSSGGSELSMEYSINGTPSLTLGSGVTKLMIAANPTIDANGAYGNYTLTFNLAVNFDGLSKPTTDAGWEDLVGFEGWLGTMLTDQRDTYQAVADSEASAATAAAEGSPTVSYGYTPAGTGSNVGSLVITISGLNVPEPASATLGLAALMMLCARRRRKA